MANRAPAAALLAAASILLAASCGDPTAPDPWSTLGFDRATPGELAPGDSQAFPLDVPHGRTFAVFVQAPEGSMDIRIRTGSDSLASTVSVFGGDTISMLRYAGPVHSENGGRYTVTVKARANSIGGAFALRPVLLSDAPESIAQSVAADRVIEGENLSHGLDVDDFAVEVTEPLVAILHVQADVSQRCAIRAEVSSISGPMPIAWGICSEADTSDLEAGGSGRIELPAGQYRVRMQQWSERHDGRPVPYRFRLRTVNTAPERVPALLLPGDTVIEAIDFVGDEDVFIVRGTPGSMINVFADASGSPGGLVVGLIPAPHGPPLHASAGGAPLLDNPIGRVELPASGEARIHASGGQFFRGDYRLFVLAIDPRPEVGSDLIVPGPSVVSGALEQYGDVDEFRFSLAAPSRIALRVPPATGPAVHLLAATSTEPLVGTRDVRLPAGEYRVRVRAYSEPLGHRGPYEFLLALVDSTVEGASRLLTVGDTARSEMTWPHDVDTWFMDIPAADTALVTVSWPEPTIPLVLTFVHQQTGAAHVQDVAYGTFGRLDLVPGRYAVHLESSFAYWMNEWMPGRRLSYELRTRRVSAAPEHRAPAFAVGDTVWDVFDFMGDLDDFLLTATPGSEVGFVYQSESPYRRVRVFDHATGTELMSDHDGRLSMTPPVTVPPGGVVRVRVDLPNEVYATIGGAYWLSAYAIDRAPESRSATFAIGDTVSDAIHAGDIDDYTFTVPDGTPVSIQFWTPAGVQGEYGALHVDLLDPLTGALLVGVTRIWQDAPASSISTYPITPPRGGTYLVRVRGGRSETSWSTGAYRFRIASP
jgi:hypothetical protein